MKAPPSAVVQLQEHASDPCIEGARPQPRAACRDSAQNSGGLWGVPPPQPASCSWLSLGSRLDLHPTTPLGSAMRQQGLLSKTPGLDTM